MLDFQDVSSCNSLKHVIALDGEDHSILHDSFSSGIHYYKRELDDSLSENVRPISFVFPVSSSFVVHGSGYVPKKTSILSPCDPRYRESYIFKTKSDYYHNIRHLSLVSLQKKVVGIVFVTMKSFATFPIFQILS